MLRGGEWEEGRVKKRQKKIAQKKMAIRNPPLRRTWGQGYGKKEKGSNSTRIIIGPINRGQWSIKTSISAENRQEGGGDQAGKTALKIDEEDGTTI